MANLDEMRVEIAPTHSFDYFWDKIEDEETESAEQETESAEQETESAEQETTESEEVEEEDEDPAQDAEDDDAEEYDPAQDEEKEVEKVAEKEVLTHGMYKMSARGISPSRKIWVQQNMKKDKLKEKIIMKKSNAWKHRCLYIACDSRGGQGPRWYVCIPCIRNGEWKVCRSRQAANSHATKCSALIKLAAKIERAEQKVYREISVAKAKFDEAKKEAKDIRHKLRSLARSLDI